jgi:hypothetical protein
VCRACKHGGRVEWRRGLRMQALPCGSRPPDLPAVRSSVVRAQHVPRGDGAAALYRVGVRGASARGNVAKDIHHAGLDPLALGGVIDLAKAVLGVGLQRTLPDFVFWKRDVPTR